MDDLDRILAGLPPLGQVRDAPSLTAGQPVPPERSAGDAPAAPDLLGSFDGFPGLDSGPSAKPTAPALPPQEVLYFENAF